MAKLFEREQVSKSNISPFKWLLVVFPAGIFILGLVSVVYYLNGGFSDEEIRLRDEREVQVPTMAGMIEKLELYAPQRGLNDEASRQGLRRALTMFGSSLGRRNAGFEVEQARAVAAQGELWAIQLVEIPPRKAEAGHCLILLSATDSDRTLASIIAAFEAMASNRESPQGLVLALLPVGPNSELSETLRHSLETWWGNRTLNQVIICEDLGWSEDLSYFGQLGGDIQLLPGMIEVSDRGRELFERWDAWFDSAPRFGVFTVGSAKANDALSQVEVAQGLERLFRRLAGLGK